MTILSELANVCNKLEGVIDIHGEKYKPTDVVDFIRKFDPSVATLPQAMDRLKNMNLYQELQRVVLDKDQGYNYNIMTTT